MRRAFICAWPAMALAALLLVFFLNTPFTIDDPIYLREAQHVLIDPLHPQAFNMVWSTDLNLRASQILPGGVAAAYLLTPVALAGCPEWGAHLSQLVLLLAAIFATALAAPRMGLDENQARIAALLTAACPAVLGMAGTVMPDIPAMLFATLGMERVMAWRGERKWHQAVFASIWLALAALTRTHTILLLAPAFVLLLDGLSAARFVPIVLAPSLYLAVSMLTADPDSHAENIVHSLLSGSGWHLILQNGLAFLAHFALVIPLTIPWLVLRARHINSTVAMTATLAATVASLKVGWVAFAAAATLIVLADILRDAIQRRDRAQLALWLWLLPAIPVLLYLHLPSKYLLPSVPAAALLIVRLIPQARRETVRWLIPGVAIAGAVMGLLILLGVRDLAGTQRRAVADLIVPHVKHGECVWFSGHWGFQWYAELAGASPVTLQPPQPVNGDIIVVSEIDLPRFPRTWSARRILQSESYPSAGPGRVMDIDAGAGFFSSIYGYLPWVWGSGDASRFEVWQVP